jgi:hypothetical protein
MIAITRILDNPANAKIPNTDRIHNTRKTDAIALKGLGRIPIIAATTRNVKRFQSVIGWLLMENNVIFGIESPLI